MKNRMVVTGGVLVAILYLCLEVWMFANRPPVINVGYNAKEQGIK